MSDIQLWGFASQSILCTLITVRVSKAQERHLTEVKIIKFNELGEKNRTAQVAAKVIPATLFADGLPSHLFFHCLFLLCLLLQLD